MLCKINFFRLKPMFDIVKNINNTLNRRWTNNFILNTVFILLLSDFIFLVSNSIKFSENDFICAFFLSIRTSGISKFSFKNEPLY